MGSASRRTRSSSSFARCSARRSSNWCALPMSATAKPSEERPPDSGGSEIEPHCQAGSRRAPHRARGGRRRGRAALRSLPPHGGGNHYAVERLDQLGRSTLANDPSWSIRPGCHNGVSRISHPQTQAADDPDTISTTCSSCPDDNASKLCRAVDAGCPAESVKLIRRP